jgi:hypothetical protein
LSGRREEILPGRKEVKQRTIEERRVFNRRAEVSEGREAVPFLNQAR